VPLADRALDSHGDEIATAAAAAATTTATATSLTMISSFRSLSGRIVARADERTVTAPALPPAVSAPAGGDCHVTVTGVDHAASSRHVHVIER